jgi:surface polysaccharide O-acyltransferase-like enzyme
MNGPSPANRLDYIDHLRVLLTVSVIMVHAAITYGGPGGWYCFEVNTADLPLWQQLFYVVFNMTNQAYFMGFFFLIAGYFTPGALMRKGASAFLRERFLRLGVPLVIFAAILSPLTIGFSQMMQGRPWWSGFYWVYRMGHYECGPMWFVEGLLIFTLLFVLWAQFYPQREENGDRPLPSRTTLLAFAVACGFAAFAIRLWMPLGKSVLGMNIGYFAMYVVLYFVGCRAAKDRWLERVEFHNALPWIVAASVALASLPIMLIHTRDIRLWTGGFNVFSYYYSVWEPFVAWGMILGLLWAARKYLNQTNPFLKHLARCSFAVYVVHAPVLVGLTLLFHRLGVAPFAKWLVVGPLACVVSWLVASAIVRTPGLRRIF